jgi:hypothetical protein
MIVTILQEASTASSVNVLVYLYTESGLATGRSTGPANAREREECFSVRRNLVMLALELRVA